MANEIQDVFLSFQDRALNLLCDLYVNENISHQQFGIFLLSDSLFLLGNEGRGQLV